MNRNSECFKKEFIFFDFISNLNVETNKNLTDSLKNEKNISVLDIYKPHLILYVFPDIFSKNVIFSLIRSLKIALKIILKNHKAEFNNLKHTNSSNNLTNFKKIGLINFSKHFFNESLKKIINFNSNIQFTVIEKEYLPIAYAKNKRTLLSKSFSIRLIILLIKNHKNLCEKFGKYNRIELYLNLYFFFNIYIKKNEILFNNINNRTFQNYKIIISNDFADPISRYILFFAKNIGIKTVFIQHGLTSKIYPEWKFNFTDYTLVSGEEIKKHIEFQNPKLENIIVTGVPNFDITKNHKINKSKSKYNILLTTQPFFPCSFQTKTLRRNIFYTIIYFAIKQTNINLTIKPHPSEPIYFYKLISKLFKNVHIENNPFIEIFNNFDILITSFSQTSIYSNLKGIPTLNVYFGNNKCHLDFIYSGANILVTHPKQLKTYLTNLDTILNYNYNQENLIPWIHLRDSNSVKRINNVLNGI